MVCYTSGMETYIEKTPTQHLEEEKNSFTEKIQQVSERIATLSSHTEKSHADLVEREEIKEELENLSTALLNRSNYFVQMIGSETAAFFEGKRAEVKELETNLLKNY
jgi:DNA repair exonuclease SbcCD ATPase subunit